LPHIVGVCNVIQYTLYVGLQCIAGGFMHSDFVMLGQIIG